MSPLVLRDVEIDGQRVDIRVDDDRVTSIGSGLATAGAEVIDGRGGALLPGLHDHHVHLLATAAATQSVRLDSAHVLTRAELERELRAAASRTPPGEWVRTVGYHESIAGDLDRVDLDALLPDRPVRVQHRSGALWMVNSRGLAELGAFDDMPGVERDATATPTGRFWRADGWLAHRWPAPTLDLAALGRTLLAYGVTGVTDATPFATLEGPGMLADAVRDGRLGLRVVVTGGPELTAESFDPAVETGPVKLLLADHDLPNLPTMTGWVEGAHAVGRPVAVHCVTADALVVTLEAIRQAGPAPGDRIEHGAVMPQWLIDDVVALRLRVVTQPGLVAARGDDYVRDVDPHDVDDLWRCGSLIDAGVPVAAGTDAPYGDLDPWRAVRAAIERRAPSGRVVGEGERLTAERALALFLSPPLDPGGAIRRVRVGAAADLCLLHVPLADALVDPRAMCVRATIVRGRQ